MSSRIPRSEPGCRLWPVLVVVVPWLQGCGAFAIGAIAAERGARQCDGVSYDNFRDRSFQIARTFRGRTVQRAVTLYVSNDCDVSYPEDLNELGIKSFDIWYPRSSSGATLVLHTRYKLADGKPISCTAPLSEFDAMELLCPSDQGALVYLLEPIR